MKITKEELNKRLKLHKNYLDDKEDGVRLDLINAYLENANLFNANLKNANLEDANLENADLKFADLRYANLKNSNFNDCCLLATLCNNIINMQKKIISVGGIGIENRITNYCPDDDKIWCGCFTGTLEEFSKRVKDTYPDENNRYRIEYDNAIKYFGSLQRLYRGSV